VTIIEMEVLMSVQENKAVIERLLDAWNSADFDAMEDAFAPEYVNHNPPPMPGFGGDRDGQLKAMRYFRQAFPDARAELVNLLAEDDKVVVHDRIRGTHQGEFIGVPPTGREATAEFIHIFRVADGRIVERWGILDAMGLMRQLGAVPTPETANV
jgi:steroid delta-isomerase-like uncharacterized protein